MQAGLFVILASIITFTRTIATSTLRNWDEAWYAEAIKNMAAGQYKILIPYWNGKLFLDNSPLYFWLSAPIVKLFGPGLWQNRIISSIAAIFACLLLFLIGKKLAGTITGLVSFLVFLSLGGVTIRFSHGNLESLLICFFLAAFYFYIIAENSKLLSFICGAFIGLGFLIKSWGIGLFPLTLIFIYSFIRFKALPKNLFIIILSTIIFSGWWYVAGIMKLGSTFYNWYILNPTENKLTSLTDLSLDYFKFAFRDIGFWFLIPAIYLILKFKDVKKLDKNIILPFTTLSFIFIIALNFLNDKSDWYLIPALALIALVIGCFGELLYRINQKLAIFLISLTLVFQIINVIRIENIYPNRSQVGADLGVKANQLIPKSDTIILDDPDFTAFLYYSNHGQIFTLEDNQKSESTEWWKVNHKDLPQFLKSHQNTWLITQNPTNLNLQFEDSQVKGTSESYVFIKF